MLLRPVPFWISFNSVFTLLYIFVIHMETGVKKVWVYPAKCMWIWFVSAQGHLGEFVDCELSCPCVFNRVEGHVTERFRERVNIRTATTLGGHKPLTHLGNNSCIPLWRKLCPLRLLGSFEESESLYGGLCNRIWSSCQVGTQPRWGVADWATLGWSLGWAEPQEEHRETLCTPQSTLAQE